MRKFIFVIILAFIFAVSANATENIQNDILSSIEPDLDKFEQTLPDYVRDVLPDSIFEGDLPSISTDFNQSTLLDYILNYLLSALPSVLKTFSSLLIIVLVISIFNLFKSSLGSEGIKTAFSLCGSVCMSIAVYQTVESVSDMCIEYMSALCITLTSFAPIMSVMHIMSGAIASAASSYTAMLLFLSIVENFIVIALSPIVKICICFAIVSSIGGGCDLSGISKTIKNTFTGICAFLLSVFSFVMSYQSVLTQGADSLSMRTARFAIGSFIPIVGGFVSESLKTITSSLSFIKSSCGVIAIIVILLMTLPVIISLLLSKLSFEIISGISRALGCEQECKITDEASTLCGFILSIVSITCVVFIFALTIFIKSSVVT